MDFWRFASIDGLVPISHSHHTLWLTALAFGIAMISACAMFPTVRSIRVAETHYGKFGWNMAGAVSMAFGIWGMHFTAMLEMSDWMEIRYDPWVTLISVIPAVIGCSITLSILSARAQSIWTLTTSSLSLALGVGTMHYVGMEAIRGAFLMRYDPASFAYSIILAWIVSALSLSTYQSLSKRSKTRWSSSLVAAAALAAAVTTMHMAGMGATEFYETSQQTKVEQFWLAPQGLILVIACLVTMTTGSLIVAELLHFKFVVSMRHLRASEERRRNDDRMHSTIVSHLTDGLFLTDLHGRIKLTNPMAERIFGFSDSTLRKRNIKDLFNAPCIEKFSNQLKEDFTGTQNFEAVRDTKESRNSRGEQIWLKSAIVPVWDGSTWFLSVNLRDVTGTMARDEELKQIAAAIDCAEDAFAIAGIDERLIYVNKAYEARYKWPRNKAIGQRSRDYLIRETTDDIREAVLATGSWQGRTDCQLHDGTDLKELGSITMIPDDSGGPQYYVSIIKDYSEQLALEQQLSQSQKLESIGQMAAGIAHEINTPTQYVGDNTRFTKDVFSDIQSLIADLSQVADEEQQISQAKYAELLERADMDYVMEEVPKALDQSIEGIERVSEIVRAMKSFSHPEEDKVQLDLNNAIQSTITVASNEWKYVATVATQFDHTLPTTPCYPGPFNQVILNILVNASHAIGEVLDSPQHTGGLGKITVSTQSVENFAEIRISDSGAGIAEGVKQKIFDPFFTTKGVGKGTGQGLNIAHDVIVNKHGGTIEVDSGEGRGTTFIIRLPLQTDSTVCAQITTGPSVSQLSVLDSAESG